MPEGATRRQLLESGDVDIVDTLTPEVVEELRANPSLRINLNPTTGIWCDHHDGRGPPGKPGGAARALPRVSL